MLLDRDIPQFHGDFVLKTLRGQNNSIMVLMLTAAGTLADKVNGLNQGADDYLAKPFAFMELLARIRALGRRRLSAEAASTILAAGDLRLDTTRRSAERGGIPLQLTLKEFGVLEAILGARGAWVTVADLLTDVWDDDDISRRQVVKGTIHTLRRKLGLPDLIESAPGFGYRIVPLPNGNGGAHA